MFLTQMGEIPLLTREQEIALAKKIEITRKIFRSKVLESDYCLNAAVEILQQVDDGDLPFDRTMKISTAEDQADKGTIGEPHPAEPVVGPADAPAATATTGTTCASSRARRSSTRSASPSAAAAAAA